MGLFLKLSLTLADTEQQIPDFSSQAPVSKGTVPITMAWTT